MLFYAPFAERPFCAWADYQSIVRNGLESFCAEIIIDTYYDFLHASAKEAAVVAMDRLRLQQVLGATDDRLLHYAHRHARMDDEILGLITWRDIELSTELDQTPIESPDCDEIIREQQYLNHLQWFVLTSAATDPFAAHRGQVQSIRERVTLFSMRANLPADIMQMVFSLPKLEDAMDIVD